MVDVVLSRVMEEIRFIKGFSKELDNLQGKIKIIAGIVDSMAAVPNEAVPWFRKTIRVIHSAEDLLDGLVYENQRIVVMKRRPKKAFSGKMRLVFLPLTRLYIRIKKASWIRKINSDIESVVKEARFVHELRALVPLPPRSLRQETLSMMTNYCNRFDEMWLHPSLLGGILILLLWWTCWCATRPRILSAQTAFP